MGETLVQKGISKSISRETVLEISALLGEPSWMKAARLRSFDVFEKTPVPTLKDEGWRYTDLSKLDLDKVNPSIDLDQGIGEGPSPPGMVNGIEKGWEVSGQLVLKNSRRSVNLLAGDLEEKGVIFTDLVSAVKRYPDLVHEYFMSRCVRPRDKFTSLNGALWGNGVFLYIPGGVEIIFPIQATLLLEGGGLGLFNHTLIIADEGSSVTYIDESRSLEKGDTAFASGVTEIFVKDMARVNYIDLQSWGDGVWDISTKRALIDRGGELTWILGTMGGKLTRYNLDTILEGEGSVVEILGLFMASQNQHMDFSTLMHHIAPNTRGDLLLKGALTDRSRSVFQGMIKIEKSAQKTDSYLANHNLLVSEKARADSMPSLEIEAHDVQASHGATVGQVDEEQVFYLMSRGLDRSEAEELIVNGFLESLLERVSVYGARERLSVLINEKRQI